MKLFAILILFVLFLQSTVAQKIKEGSKIIVNNPLIYQVIPENATIEILGEGFDWSEGPVWLADQQKLLFSDIPQNIVYEWTENGGVKKYLEPSGYTGTAPLNGEPGSNGLLLSPNGELVLCQHGNHQMGKMKADLKDPKPEFETIVNNYKGKRLNSPNDAAYHINGDLYFTDPPYGLEFRMDDPLKELNYQGIFKTDSKGNTVLLTKKLSRPNGIAFSNDYTKLYVSNSDPENAIWMVYDVDKKGLIKNGKVLFDVTDRNTEVTGNPDGLKVHKNGWIFASGPEGVFIFTPEGENLGHIYTGTKTANCAFNEDFSVLFITAKDYLLRVRLKR